MTAPPPAGIAAVSSPWERILWSDDYKQHMFRDWGTAFTQKNLLDAAINNYDKSLQLKDDDAKALYLRGLCQLQLAQTDLALADSYLAGDLREGDVKIDLQQCRALYELNRLEDAKVLMHDNTRKYVGAKSDLFQDNIIVIEQNLADSVGDSYGPFIMKAEKYFKDVLEAIERRNHVEKRPLWKILREQGKCDVVSVLEKEEELLSPREIARRERAFRVFNQLYLNTSWKDLIFLRDMRTNPTLLWPPSKVSVPILKNLVDVKYKTAKKFEKMLHVRSPLYNEMLVKFGNRSLWEKNRDNYLNRVQYQTRRNMITILRTIKKLRAEKQINKLRNYIEEIMGDYVVLKTHRVMCWKFEFMNEVYNTLALAYADQYMTIPDVSIWIPEPNRILVLLRLPTEHKEKPAFVFGDRSTYQEPDVVDTAFVAYKNFLTRLEKRIVFAKYPIEKCYLYHEMAYAHLKQNHLNECVATARKAIEEVKNFNNHLWAFLSTMLMVKAYASVYKIEYCFDVLKEACELALILRSPELIAFVTKCREYNESDIQTRKRERSLDASSRRRKSRTSMSTRSWLSADSSQLGEEQDGEEYTAYTQY